MPDLTLTIKRAADRYVVTSSIGMAFGDGDTLTAALHSWLDDWFGRLADFREGHTAPSLQAEHAAMEAFMREPADSEPAQ